MQRGWRGPIGPAEIETETEQDRAMTLNRTVARLPFIVAAALVTVTSFTLTAPAHAAAQGLFPFAAAGVEATVATGEAAAAAAAASSKKICHNVEITGTRMTKKVCKTQAQWDAEAAAQASK
jgi:hypothetical protein